jgi:capsular exopolysaccharide synthesis family protein
MQSEDVANRYKNALAIESVGDKFSSILELKLIDQTPFKAQDILNTLIEVYNQEEIADNLVILERTVSFVDERIGRLSHELDSIETNIESFKSRNNIISESAESSLNFSLGELRSALAKLTDLELERELMLALENNLTNNPESLIPTNVSGNQPALAGLIDEYNELFLQRKKLDETVSDENPLYKRYTVQLNDLRGLIGRSLKNVESNLEIPIAQARTEIDQLQKNITSIPSVEKNLLDKLRLQSIKENLYLFLLQKKEETELSMAISRANTRIIEPARSSGGAIFPNPKITRLASVGLGLTVPILIIVLLDLMKVAVEDEETVKSLTSMPVLGRIPHYKKGENVLLKSGERSIRAEMFKLLRTNLDFANVDKKERVFVITSSMGGEGKSITAINLGITISLADKKVIIIDMDLRKPKIGKYLGMESEKGVTSFLVGDMPLSDVIARHPDYPNLSFINSGPVPPNPTEMILSDKTGDMIAALKKEYDYIIIDSPPIGVVTDGLLLRPHMTNMLYVVRHKKTRKDSLKMTEELYQQGEFPNPGIIINDIEVSRRSQAYGGYHSGYGYGYYLNN